MCMKLHGIGRMAALQVFSSGLRVDRKGIMRYPLSLEQRACVKDHDASYISSVMHAWRMLQQLHSIATFCWFHLAAQAAHRSTFIPYHKDVQCCDVRNPHTGCCKPHLQTFKEALNMHNTTLHNKIP